MAGKMPPFMMKGKDSKKGAKGAKEDMPKFAKGGSIDGVAKKGKTKGTFIAMKKGGKC